MEFKRHEKIEQRMCKELEMLEAKYAQNPSQEMTIQDLDRIDKLYHALKCMATYDAMKEAEEYEEEGWSGMDEYGRGTSGRRGRAMNGRYVSRDMGAPMGYDGRYAPDWQQSGHYPMPPYYSPRSW